MRSIKGYKAYIKVGRETQCKGATEHFWVERTFGGYAIDNIPFHSRRVAYGDVVRIDEETGQILTIVRRSPYRTGTITYGARRTGNPNEAQYHRIRTVLENHGILIERFMAGVAGVAIPLEITDEQFWRIIKGLPEIMGGEIVAKRSN